jgi:cell division protein ZapA (FtsZ GTPase activity inhibitor)
MSLVKLHINNREFDIECGLGQEDMLVNLSHELDRRVKNNAQIFGDNNNNLLLVVTALQLLDELQEVRNGAAGVDINAEISRNTAETLSQISGRIEEVTEKLLRKSA